jgi:hypothetical protein
MRHTFIIVLASCCFISHVFALDQAVKEETNPPAAETAITPSQIPPILTTTQATQQPTPPPQ